MKEAHGMPLTVEDARVVKSTTREEDWQRWGTYLPERQWGTVRENYSADGSAWNFTHFAIPPLCGTGTIRS